MFKYKILINLCVLSYVLIGCVRHSSGGGSVVSSGCDVQQKINAKLSLQLQKMYLLSRIFKDKCSD
jgi:hypothetical protein